METKKIGIAIFVGILVGAIVVLVTKLPVLPRWLLGVSVGVSVGFLFYDLREVREKAPIAWRKAKRGGEYSLDWLKKPHPFFWPFSIIFGASMFFLVKLLWVSDILAILAEDKKETPLAPKIISTFLCSGLIFSIISFCFSRLVILILLGAYKKKVIWEPSDGLFHKFLLDADEKKEMHEQNYRIILATYRNVYGLALTGLGCWLLIVLDRVKKELKEEIVAGWMLLYFFFYKMWVLLGLFIWYLFKLISSHERVLCAIYCAIGVTVIHVLFGHQLLPLGQKIIIAISGGIIGAAIGVLHYEIISKRLLRLIPT